VFGSKGDPDVKYPFVLLFGDEIPRMWGKKRLGFMPYHLQHLYWFAIVPMVLPFYFFAENLYFMFKRHAWLDIFFLGLFCWRFFAMFDPYVGHGGSWILYFTFRMIESYWFMWVTQMNHIPMEISRDKRKDWVSLQLGATCNVEQSLFNDWFTGHLNFQIEHHLFPTMPRHNYAKVNGMVKQLCEKHSIPFQTKTLWNAWVDIVRSLKHSGKLWFDAYYHL